MLLSQPWTLWSKKSKGYLSNLMIEALPMVRTEAGVNAHRTIFLDHLHRYQVILIYNLQPSNLLSNDHPRVSNHVNHHHQDVLYDNFLTKILPTRKNSSTPSIPKTISKMKVTMKGRPMGEALGGWRILIPTGEKDFFFLT